MAFSRLARSVALAASSFRRSASRRHSDWTDAYAVIRETIRSLDKVAPARVVLANPNTSSISRLLAKKQKGQPISAPTRQTPGNVINLMDALRGLPSILEGADERSALPMIS
jgi:non-homologous end joining protein Ku